MYFFDDNYFELKKLGVKEGGIARNNAWIQFLKKYRPEVVFVNFKITHRVLKYLNFLYFFFKCNVIRNNKVFFLYPKVGLPILIGGWRGNLFRKLFLHCISVLKKHNNEIILDISDIKYEQAIDLELSGLDMEAIREFEKELFSLDLKFVFASYSMREYAVKTHGMDESNTDVCINGGAKLDHQVEKSDMLPEDKIKYVYAGTLNKGRMIEQMIEAFPDSNQHALILMGSDGEWIREYIRDVNRTNVYYLGAFEERVARNIVAQCDVGVIPYDDTRLYYNIAYPTKLSFYITAGVPFFSTPVSEVNKVLSKFDLGFTEKLENWTKRISKLTKEEIAARKQKVQEEKHHFEWETIFSNCKFLD